MSPPRAPRRPPTKPSLRLTAARARALHLAAQGLLTAPRRAATPADVLGAIRRMEVLQIDTIHVVARSPYLVLFSRLPDYRPEWLDAHLSSRAIFETWAHEACFAPIEDYALHRRAVEERAHWGTRRARRTLAEREAEMRALLDHIRERGPVRAADFERAADDPARGKSAWWGWKEEKEWLEAWFALGELMVARREGFHRVYDLRERVYPAAASLPRPSAEEVRRALAERALRALGVSQARWVSDYFRAGPRWRDEDLAPLVAEGSLLRVEVDGWDAPGYVHRDHEALLRRAAAGELGATHTTLLSPFDPVVWDRERALTMFDFDYRLECYTPAPRRRHGYFVLPILRRGALVGRLDAKAHRQEGVFEVKALHLEPGVRPTEALVTDVAAALRRCAAWHGLGRVTVARSDPAALRRALLQRLRAD